MSEKRCMTCGERVTTYVASGQCEECSMAFTWDDVDRLGRYMTESAKPWDDRHGDTEWLASLAYRIEALLPPRDES